MMAAKFSGSFLVATLVIYGSTATIAEAQAAATGNVAKTGSALVNSNRSRG